jgi:hypothetical protein
MIALKGVIKDGQVILRQRADLPDGTEVQVLPIDQQEEGSVAVSRERQEAWQQLIGIWKTEQPPDDEQVEQILEQERMRKYG